MPVVAEISITPMVEGQVKPFIDAALQVIDQSGLKYEVGAAGTTVEGELDQVVDVLKNAHKAAINLGAHRVVTTIHLDQSREGVTLEQELEGYREPALQRG
jgi:uncharacterized protein (TIGR00106 family)